MAAQKLGLQADPSCRWSTYSHMLLKHKPIPRWLYSALPFVYLAVGVVTTLVVSHAVGALVGLALVGLATGIWISRYRYRRTFTLAQRRMDSPTVFSNGDLPEGGLIQVSWNQTLECGHPVIDGQHRRLFGSANEAITLLLEKGPKAKEEKLLRQLIEQLQTHCIAEETLLERALAPQLGKHRAEHQVLLEKAKDMLKRFHDGEAIAKDLVTFLSKDVISEHIISEDISILAGLT